MTDFLRGLIASLTEGQIILLVVVAFLMSCAAAAAYKIVVSAHRPSWREILGFGYRE